VSEIARDSKRPFALFGADQEPGPHLTPLFRVDAATAAGTMKLVHVISSRFSTT
jgi:hypothetical protein